MNKYYIVNGREYLCKSKGEFTDKSGNKRTELTYWSKFPETRIYTFKGKEIEITNRDRLRLNIFKAAYILFLIKLLNPDIKPKLKRVK